MDANNRFLLTTLFLGFVFSGLAADSSSLEAYLKKLGYESIELKNDTYNQMVVQGAFASGKKARFLVDTGWGFTALDESAARGQKTLGALGIEVEDKILGRLTNADYLLIDKLTLGKAQFLNQPARVKKLRMDFIYVSFDGVLGYDFFLRNFCLIDVAARRLYVRSTEPSEQQSRALETSFLQSGFAPVEMRPGILLEINAEANGKSLAAGVDTGADFSLIDESQMPRLSLIAIKQDRPETGTLIPNELNGRVVGVGSIGAHKLRVTTLNTFRLGSTEWKNLHFGIADLKAWNLGKPSAPAEHLQALLGSDFLLSHGALIDFSSRKLWLSPEKSPASR